MSPKNQREINARLAALEKKIKTKDEKDEKPLRIIWVDVEKKPIKRSSTDTTKLLIIWPDGKEENE